MSDLTINITEEITLPNNNIEKISNKKVISNINQIVRRVDTITTSFSGSGIEILRFVDSESQQVAGSFVKGDVKYIRITHISGSSDAILYFLKTDQESTLLKLSPGKSIMLNDASFDASSINDYVEETYVDPEYYSNFVSLDVIKAKASGSNVQLEYFVASL